MDEITAVVEPAAITPVAVAVIGAGETHSNAPVAVESESSTVGDVAPYLFFLLMIGGLVSGRFWLSRRSG